MIHWHGRHGRRLIALAIVFALAAAAGAVAWALLDDETRAEPVEEGAFVEGLAGTWQRINPLFASANEVDADIASLVFAGLVRIGPDGTVEPDLAELPEVSEDGRTYTFRLRDGLTWHDGQPLTSADVRFTIGRLVDPEFRGDPALAEPWLDAQVSTPDALTVVVQLSQPSAPFVARNATIGIVPQHLLEGLGGAALYDASFNTVPVGAGPYRLVSLSPESAELVANSRYHLGAPALGRLVLRFYSDYPSAVAAFAAEQVDAVMVRETLTAATLAEIEALPDVAITAYDRSAYLMLFLNNEQALFNDARVRKAIALAVDREALVRDRYSGRARASASVIAPGTWAYDPAWDDISPDREQAATLLDEAGWTVNPATGVRTLGGNEFRFTIRTDTDPDRVALAQAIALQLEGLGIRASVVSTTFLVLQRDFLRERRYDAAIVGWDQGPDPDPYFGWHSSQVGTAGLNLANFGNIVTDELIARARTVQDPVVRTELYRQLQEKWDELAPSVVLVYPEYLYLHRAGLTGPEPGVLSTPSQRFANIHLWTQ